jgi:hypothetical protein
MQYTEFLKTKIVLPAEGGFAIDPAELSPDNFPHQRDGIIWACKQGQALIAWRFGLGKTRAQCEIAKAIVKRTGRPFLTVCPLGVQYQFSAEDGPVLGMRWKYVRTDAEVLAADTPYLLTNYERVRDGSIHPSTLDLGGASLDEGNVLRSLGSKTSQVFKDEFANIRYRFVCTATPSPNENKELIYFAEFLGKMDHGQALTRFFKRDSEHAGHLTLMPSQEEKFWLWVASWALFIGKPSDLGYSDDGYDLPQLNSIWHRLPVDHRRAWDQVDNRGQGRLLLDAAGGVSEAAAEKKATLDSRIAKMREIAGDFFSESDASEQIIVWCHQDNEQRNAERTFREMGISYSSIYGSLPIEETEKRLYEWLGHKTRVLIGKPVMLGSGLNLQQCHFNIYIGIDYKFNAFIQSLHRTHRFMQTKTVIAHMIYAESEDQIQKVLLQKWGLHDELQKRMQGIISKYGLTRLALQSGLERQIGVNRMEVKSNRFISVNNDCVVETAKMPTDYAGMICTSIPFGNHYEYTTQVEDFGHNLTDADFWTQMDHLIPDLMRVLKPGRVAAIHVKDRILYGHQTKTGFMEVAPFSDECVMAFRKHGWLYEGRRTVVTDVVRENNSTYRLGYTEMTHDASKMGSGLPEYVLLFRKPPTKADTARADEVVSKNKADYSRGRWQVDAHSFWRSDGNTPIRKAEIYDYQGHIARLEEMERSGNLPASFFYEPPKSHSTWVWDDVIFMRTLNTNQSMSRSEKHICPLPFDIVERLIRLYSNEGDIVFDPFAGLHTVPYLAIKLGRFGHGIELNHEYWTCGVKYCQDMERQVECPTLFGYLETVEKSAAG